MNAGRLSKRHVNVTLTGNLVKQHLGLPLSSDEEELEREFQKTRKDVNAKAHRPSGFGAACGTPVRPLPRKKTLAMIAQAKGAFRTSSLTALEAPRIFERPFGQRQSG